MNRMQSTKKLLTVLAGLLCVVLVGYAGEFRASAKFGAAFPEASTIGAGQPSFDEILQRFRELAEEKGAQYAFDVLRVAQLPVGTDVHLTSHEIGHVLYTQQGVNGMSVCTQEFGNGCSHSLVIDALHELGDGPSTLALVDGACRKAAGGDGAYTMCYHGFGHGVFAYYGYTFPKTIALCEKTGTDDRGNIQAKECIGGAVMELLSGGGHDRDAWTDANKTYFSASDPLAPCNTDTIPEFAKSYCYVYLSPHYMSYQGATMERYTDEQLTNGMKICEVLPFGAERSACIGGFGKDFAGIIGNHDLRKKDAGEYSDDQLREVDRLCGHAPAHNDVLACTSYALSTFFWGGAANPDISVRYCGFVSDGAARTYCFNNLADNIARFVTDSKGRRDRCDGLPAEFELRCTTK